MRWPRVLGIAAGLLGWPGDAHAAWLHACPATVTTQGTKATVYLDPEGGRWRVFLDENRTLAPGCHSTELPVNAGDVVALKPLSKALAARPGDDLTITGGVKAGETTVNAIEAAGGAPTPPRNTIMPFGDNLLAAATLRTFGAEERARISRKGQGLVLQCDLGTGPAGLHLSGPWYLPEAQISLSVAGAGKGKGNFTMYVADQAHQAAGTGVLLGVLDSAALAGAATWKVPRAGLDRQQWEAITISCPSHSAELRIDSVMLVTHPGRPGSRATWVWSPDIWQTQPDRVFELVSKYAIKSLFVTVPVTDGAVAESALLSDFIRRASRLGVSVWAVDGDPHMLVPQEHAKAVARVRAYRAYNDAVDANVRLRGVQFDIEPYVLPEYESAPQQWDLRLAELARHLRMAAESLEFELVVPFWWAEQKADLLQRLAPSVTGLTIMDYRTSPKEILRFAAPFLDWGVVHHKQVRIALEAGPVDAETHWHYTRAETGQLWILQVGAVSLAVLLNKPYRNRAGAAFRLADTRVHDGSATTFHRDPQRLLQVLPALETDLSAWASFAGIALHEIR